MKLSKLFSFFGNLFGTKQLNSSEQIHWVNHIHDDTVSWPNKGLMWANVHGFDEGPGKVYWVGVDVRSFGIRVADYIVRCNSKRIYDEYIDCASRNTEKFLYKMRDDARMNCRGGSDVNIEFIFKWGGEEKTFDVHLGTDSYAEEK